MTRASLLATLGALALACGPASSRPDSPGTIAFEPDRPTPGGATPAAVYTGTDADVLAAQATYPRGTDLHLKLVLRTCSGTNGVCHNQKEYPDLHTEGTFLSAIGAPCNVQSGNPSGVYDRCERLGDRFRFAEQEFNKIEIGWFELVRGASPKLDPKGERPEDGTAGLHLYLHDPLPGTSERQYVTGTFIRNFVDAADEVQELAFASYKTNWWVFPDRRHLFAEVGEGQRDAVEGLVASGIVQGDQNRNGVFGARLAVPVPLLNPGNPEESYLVARLRGTMRGQSIPGTRMPLANQPPSVPDMLALMCFIEGLDPKASAWSLQSSIDYTKCTYAKNPQALNLAGEGTTWSGGVLPILQSNCGGCHGGDNPQGGLNLLGPAPEVHARLFRKPSLQNPAMNLIELGDPLKSYLWLKISGDGPISGARMPLNPLDGTASLPADQLKKIEEWISFGASNN